MMTTAQYSRLTPELIEQYKNEASETLKKRQEALDKLNPKKQQPQMVFDVRPEALAKIKQELSNDGKILQEQTTKSVETDTKEQKVNDIKVAEKKKGGRPKKKVVDEK